MCESGPHYQHQQEGQHSVCVSVVSSCVRLCIGAGNENESCKSGTADSLSSLSSAATTATLTATGSLGLETAGMRWQRRRQRNVQRHRKLHNTNFAHAPKIYEFLLVTCFGWVCSFFFFVGFWGAHLGRENILPMYSLNCLCGVC